MMYVSLTCSGHSTVQGGTSEYRLITDLKQYKIPVDYYSTGIFIWWYILIGLVLFLFGSVSCHYDDDYDDYHNACNNADDCAC